MSNRKNYKKALVIGYNVAVQSTDSIPIENRKLSFLTDLGVIEGKLAEDIKTFKMDNIDEAIQGMESLRNENGAIPFRDIAVSFADNFTKDEEVDESNVIHLDDVIIKRNNGDTIYTENITLFLDRIIGVIAGVPEK